MESWIIEPPTLKPIEISNKYEDFALKYSTIISNLFQNRKKYNIFQSKNNKDFIKRIEDLSPFLDDIKKIISNYSDKYFLYRLNISRHCETNLPSNLGKDFDGKDHWHSEMWHVDGILDGFDVFKIIMYLNDINNSDDGPTEYYLPLTYSNKIGKRFNYSNSGKKIIGKKGTTIIFYPYIIHRGNYCRKGYRDTLNLSFCLNEKHKSGLSDKHFNARQKRIDEIQKILNRKK